MECQVALRLEDRVVREMNRATSMSATPDALSVMADGSGQIARLERRGRVTHATLELKRVLVEDRTSTLELVFVEALMVLVEGRTPMLGLAWVKGRAPAT